MSVAQGPVSAMPADGARSITARSVVASILLAMEPPVLPVRALVRLGELFGIAEGTTRVALSRMVASGELSQDDDGYRLTGRMLGRQERQRRSRHPRLVPWEGGWLLAVVVVDRRAGTRRSALRQAMRVARMGEVRSGVWGRPDNLAAEVLAPAPEPDEGGTFLWFRGSLAEAGLAAGAGPSDAADAELAARLWDLPGWAAEAERLVGALSETLPALVAGDTEALAPCFVVAAAAVRHITADPLLPAPLLPPAWPGDRLRASYDEYETAYGRLLTAWLRAGLDRG
jgi:phenylacetic acid degradation operon negative regulatory protein